MERVRYLGRWMTPDEAHEAAARHTKAVDALVEARVNDRPRVLLYAIDRADYKPRLQGAWDDAVAIAIRKIDHRMATELRENLRHEASEAYSAKLGRGWWIVHI